MKKKKIIFLSKSFQQPSKQQILDLLNRETINKAEVEFCQEADLFEITLSEAEISDIVISTENHAELLQLLSIDITGEKLFLLLKKYLIINNKISNLLFELLASKSHDILKIKSEIIPLYDLKTVDWYKNPLRYFFLHYKCYDNEYIDLYLDLLSNSNISVIEVCWHWPRCFHDYKDKLSKEKIRSLYEEFKGLPNESMSAVQEKRLYMIFSLAKIINYRPSSEYLPFVWNFYINCSEGEAQMYIRIDIGYEFEKHDLYTFLINNIQKVGSLSFYHRECLGGFPVSKGFIEDYVKPLEDQDLHVYLSFIDRHEKYNSSITEKYIPKINELDDTVISLLAGMYIKDSLRSQYIYLCRELMLLAQKNSSKYNLFILESLFKMNTYTEETVRAVINIYYQEQERKNDNLLKSRMLYLYLLNAPYHRLVAGEICLALKVDSCERLSELKLNVVELLPNNSEIYNNLCSHAFANKFEFLNFLKDKSSKFISKFLYSYFFIELFDDVFDYLDALKPLVKVTDITYFIRYGVDCKYGFAEEEMFVELVKALLEGDYGFRSYQVHGLNHHPKLQAKIDKIFDNYKLSTKEYKDIKI